MEPIRNVISKLKLRASVGTVGNDNIGGRRFAYITTINSKANGYNWGYTGDTYRDGVQEGEVGVGNLTWEKALKTNIGIEIGLWNELDFQLDLFKERRTSIFMPPFLPKPGLSTIHMPTMARWTTKVSICH